MALVTAVLAVASGGCAEEEPQGEFTLRNRSEAPLFHDDTKLPRRTGIAIPIDGCQDSAFVVTDKAGTELARLQPWCAGQRWTILGPGRSRLD